MVRNLLSLLFSAVCGGVFGQTILAWGPEISCGSSNEGNVSPRVQVNGSGDPVAMWGLPNPATVHVSVGDGISFSPATTIHPVDLSPTALSWTGADMAANGDTIWAVMKATPDVEKPCYAVRSLDGGLTWGDTMRVDPVDSLLSRFPSVAIIPDVGPIVQYMQFDPGFGDPRYVTSRMVGGIFQAPVQVSTPFAPGEVCDCCPGQAVASGNTTVSLYRNAGSNIRVIWGAASTDGGANYPVGGSLDGTNWLIAACPASGPDGYLAGDSLRTVWMSGGNGGTHVYLSSAHVQNLAVGREVKLSQGLSGTHNYPKIDGQGDTLGIVWQRAGSGVSGIFFSHSTTGINGLSAPDTVAWGSAGSFHTPDIAFSNGTFHLVWGDNQLDVVRYRSATLMNVTSVGSREGASELHAWPVPASETLELAGDLRPFRNYELIDMAGRCAQNGVLQGSRLSVRELPSGGYMLRLHGPEAERVLRIHVERTP